MQWVQKVAKDVFMELVKLKVPFKAVGQFSLCFKNLTDDKDVVEDGQEDEQAEREAAFASFCVDQALMDHAAKDAIALHCLPAHRGEEITAEVLEGASSRIFDQADNRLHAQQALLAALMGGL